MGAMRCYSYYYNYIIIILLLYYFFYYYYRRAENVDGKLSLVHLSQRS